MTEKKKGKSKRGWSTGRPRTETGRIFAKPRTVTLTEPEVAWIEAAARERGVTFSEHLRGMLDVYIALLPRVLRQLRSEAKDLGMRA